MINMNNSIFQASSWKKIKSKYILSQIFENLKQKKLLNTIRYNKKIKIKLKKNKRDYIREYSKIVIEIIPKENVCGYFININSKYAPYYHFYFNDDNNEEIEKLYINENDKVSKIKIVIDKEVKCLSRLFYKCRCIKIVNFIKCDIKNFKNMAKMFDGCTNLEKINFSNFDTSNVVSMRCMFNDCYSLKELNISNFDTNNVKLMTDMFCNCSSLEELNLSNFNTNNVINMSYMFYRCLSLKKLNLSNFSINNVENMRNIFKDCSSLEIICSDEFKKIISKAYPNFKFLSPIEVKQIQQPVQIWNPLPVLPFWPNPYYINFYNETYYPNNFCWQLNYPNNFYFH